jgi:hypothetical protein
MSSKMSNRSFQVFACAINVALIALTENWGASAANAQPQRTLRAEKSDPMAGRASTFQRLKDLATEQLTSDLLYLGRSRFSIATDQKLITYDFSPFPLADILSANDSLAIPLEAVMRIEALRRDFGRVVQREGFWRAPLTNAEVIIRESLARSYQQSDNQLRQKLKFDSERIEEQFNNLETAVFDYADRKGLDVERSREPAKGYPVTIKIEPKLTRVRFMPFLAYRKCVYFKTPLDDEWNDLDEGTHTMIGRYHYRAEWPADLNGPEEGNFEIREETTVTFRPARR